MANPGICILTETFYPEVGGGEIQARALADGLAAAGIAVHLLTRRSQAGLEPVQRLGATTVHRLPPAGRQHYKKWGLLFSSLPMLLRLRREYDLVFVSGFRVIGLAAVLGSRMLGKACILKADSLGEMSGDFFAAGLARLHLGGLGFVLRRLLTVRNWVLAGADAFVAISAEVVAELQAQGVDPGKIHRIPNSVDTARFCPISEPRKRQLRRALGFAHDDLLVTYVGRLVSYKGLPLLLRVWGAIQADHPRARLLLVGSGGLDIHNCEAELRDDIRVHGLAGRVQLTGNVENVQEYLQISDIFVFPTENEAFGISLIEAMACALPVIASRTGGVKDIVEHGITGLLVEAGDFDQLRDALKMLISDPALAGTLAAAGWRVVQERYSAQHVLKQYLELVRSLRPAQTATLGQVQRDGLS